MKKIMIAAIAVAFAAVAQAASVNWAAAAKVVTPSETGSASAGRASYYTALVFTADQLTAVTTALESVAHGADFTEFNKITAKSSYQAPKTGAFSGTVTDLEGATATLFAVVFDTQAQGDTIDKATFFQVTGTVTQNTYSGLDAATTATFTAAEVSNSWTAIESVPEPTSGLLMLLGMAGLALRRRRA